MLYCTFSWTSYFVPLYGWHACAKHKVMWLQLSHPKETLLSKPARLLFLSYLYSSIRNIQYSFIVVRWRTYFVYYALIVPLVTELMCAKHDRTKECCFFTLIIQKYLQFIHRGTWNMSIFIVQVWGLPNCNFISLYLAKICSTCRATSTSPRKHHAWSRI